MAKQKTEVEILGQFKYLLKRFIELEQQNENSMEKIGTMGGLGFENNQFKHESGYDKLVLDGISYSVKANEDEYSFFKEGLKIFPYVRRGLGSNQYINVRIKFKDREMIALGTVLFNSADKTEVNLAEYLLEDLDLFSDAQPNQNLADFYAKLISYQLPEKENQLETELAAKLKASKNIILRGAPGTGKSYLAKKIAVDLVSGGTVKNYASLTSEQRQHIGFVQFHPSYDYTDFVEGLRPVTSDDGVVSFQLKAGSFKEFIERAVATRPLNGQDNFDDSWALFFETVSEFGTEGYNELKTLQGKSVKDLVAYERSGVQGVYPVGTKTYLNHDQIYKVYKGLPGVPKRGLDNYRQAIVEHLKQNFGLKKYVASTSQIISHEKYVFIIDEINRGEISKIFGELFFSIDPGYRGEEGSVSTQYANLHEDPTEKFYIPDNVYIIGTMNDIDRSVDSFDFAMRRRFRFIEIKANEHIGMLEDLGDTRHEAVERMIALNEAIIKVDELNENYQIGAAYFRKLATISADQLWTDYLEPLLQDYVRGMQDEAEYLVNFKTAYDMYDETVETIDEIKTN